MAQDNLQLTNDAIALSGGDPIKPAQTKYQKFGNWTGQMDVSKMWDDLKKRGLIGAQTGVEGQPSNPNDPNSVRNASADWKVTAIQHILANAKRLDIRTPEAYDANMDALTSTLDPKYRDALKNESFKQIHPNWDNVIKQILTEQHSKFDKMDNIAKK